MGRRKTRGRKRKNYKEVDSDDEDEDEVQVIQQVNDVHGNPAAKELHPLPSSSRYSTRSNTTKVTEAKIQSHTPRDQAEEITSQPSEKDRELNVEDSLNNTNRESSPNLTDLVQKLNKNVSDAEEVDSATQTALVAVAGYTVKREVAPLLREILSEHGDIASECILQASQTRAALLESVCTICRELEPKIPNIMSLEVGSMQARIKDLETVRLRVDWLSKRLEEVSTVKGLLDKSSSLDEARARCTESIEREERDLEALEAELSNIQQKISSKKAELTSLKNEAETIEAALETTAGKALPEQPVVSMNRSAGGKKFSRPTPSRKFLNENDAQLHSQTTLQHNKHKFIDDPYQKLRENDHPQPGYDSVTVAYLNAEPCNPLSHSQSYNLQSSSRQPHSLPHSISQNPQQRSTRSNLHPHSNHFSKPQHSAQSDSENEYDQNYVASSDDINDMNTRGGDRTPINYRGTQNQGYNLAESSSRRARGIRGMTKPLRGWGTGQKMMLQLNEQNQIIGNLASPFASQLGVLAKDGKKLPLAYMDWRTIPEIFKERIWNEIKENTNLNDDYEKSTLQRLSKLWRCWKGTIKELYFTPYRNDDEKLAQHPPEPRIEKDQWPILVRFWKSKAALEVHKENKITLNERKSETSTGHQIGDEELEPEGPGQVHIYSPERTSSKIPTAIKMVVPEYQKKALDLAVRAHVEEVVGNMRETMTGELTEIFSGKKQKSMSGLRGHMAFAVPYNRNQVPESSSVQPATRFFEDHSGEMPNHDSTSAEVNNPKRRKKLH